jgi:DNA invertase Pin-like site-specific DNA recombinase
MQRSELAHAGLHEKNIFVDEAIGGKFASRPQLDKMLNKLKQGDTVTVYRLDRIGRTLSNLLTLMELFQARGVEFKSLHESIDTTTAIGTLIFHIFASLAQYERELIRERTMAGLAAAREAGVTFGRREVLSKEQKQLAYQLAYGGQTITSIARVMKCSRSTVYRALREEVQSGVERLSRTCCVVRWVQSRRPQQVCLHVTYRGRSEWLTA